MRLQNLMDELERQKPLKWDTKVPASELRMERRNGGVGLTLPGRDGPLPITTPCHAQIAERLEIPVRYYHKMAEDAPDLLIDNVNTWLQKENKPYFVRGLDTSVRALLSERYRVIDHTDVLLCALNELQAHDTEVESCFLSETEMNLKVKSHRLKDFVRDRGDLILGGLLLTNSETGHKALRLEPRLYRVLCSNGMVIEELVSKQIHLGNGNGNGDSHSDDQVYISIRRSIQELFGQFGEIVETLRITTEVKVRKPVEVIHNLVEHYRLSEAQRDNILLAFGAEPVADQYGIANAVTRAAQAEESWEKSLELERLGGSVLRLPMRTFQEFDA